MNKLKKFLVVLLVFIFISIFINIFVIGKDDDNDNPQAETVELSEDTIIF